MFCLEIYFWNWMLWALVLPVDGHDPPAAAVVEQLNAVDSAHERFGIVVFVARLVCAPNMRDPTKLLGGTAISFS